MENNNPILDFLQNREERITTTIREDMVQDLITPLIRPYLVEAPLFQESYSELFDRWDAIVGPEEARKICAREHPDVPMREWNGLILTYIIEWQTDFPLVHDIDYVTRKMIQSWNMTEEELFEIATNNMDKLSGQTLFSELEPFELQKFKGAKIYKAFYDNKVDPAIGASIMVSSKLLEYFRNYIGTDFYFLPLGKNRCYLVGIKEVCQYSLDSLQEEISESILFKGPILTRKKYIYKNGALSLLQNSAV